MTQICKRVLYAGRVQGVGFRWTAQQLARGCAVQGFVRNLPDGQVELQVEGDQAVVDDYLRRVAERMRENILAANVEAMPPRGFERFEVRM